MTVWVYVNTSKQVGDKDHLKVFANEIAADMVSRKRPRRGCVRVPCFGPLTAQVFLKIFQVGAPPGRPSLQHFGANGVYSICPGQEITSAPSLATGSSKKCRK
jgi:hypothetical protein